MNTLTDSKGPIQRVQELADAEASREAHKQDVEAAATLVAPTTANNSKSRNIYPSIAYR